MHAPDFSLVDQHGVTHTLQDYRGRWVVLYVYPKDDTPGCTKEACGFRDLTTAFSEQGAVVLGISKDTARSHGRFAEKFSLTFPLLADPTTETIQALGAWGEKKFMGKTFIGTLRQSFLINPEGEIAKRYESVDPITHPEAVLADLKELQA
jgi:peroxiredoxin Q/BCP